MLQLEDYLSYQGLNPEPKTKERIMKNLNIIAKPTIFDNLITIDCRAFRINRPDDCFPLDVDTKLHKYNEALKRLDIKKAEETADEILESLHRHGTLGV
jgi:hypothetical protein